MKPNSSKKPDASPQPPPRWNGPPTENVIVPAFELGGIQYFMYLDTSGTSSGRAFEAIVFQEEYNMRVTKDHLLAYTKAVKECLNAKDIVQAGHLTMVLEKRLEFIIEPDILYKLASVTFFDETENPFTYDFAYNQKKIERWKEMEVEDFFYGTPMRSYLPSLATFEGGLQHYIAMTRALTAQELTSYISILSRNPANSATVDYLKSQVGTLIEWLRSHNYLSTNTMYT